MKIQTYFRAHRNQKLSTMKGNDEVEIDNRFAVVIAPYVQCYSEICLLQRWVRGRSVRAKLTLFSQAAFIIQRSWKRYVSLLRKKLLHVLVSLSERNMKLSYIAMLYAQSHAGFVALQSRVRGALVRKRLHEESRSSSRMEAYAK